MLCYYLKFKKINKVQILKFQKLLMVKQFFLSKYVMCGGKKLRFIKEQEAKGILNSWDLKIPLSKIPLLGNISFWMQFKIFISKW